MDCSRLAPLGSQRGRGAGFIFGKWMFFSCDHYIAPFQVDLPQRTLKPITLSAAKGYSIALQNPWLPPTLNHLVQR
jgi:hypothetical protein